MPRPTYRKLAIRYLTKQLLVADDYLALELAFGGSSDSDDDAIKEAESMLDDAVLIEQYAKLELEYATSHRYYEPRVCKRSGLNIFEEDLDPDADYWTTARSFKEKYRCSVNRSTS